MGKILEKKKKEIEKSLKNFEKLSKCRNMDFPNNLTQICKINLKLLNDYYETKINENIRYELKYDYILITFIYNFLASLKSYLNRKKKDIERRVPVENKQDLLNIFEKYWKAARNQTIIDQLIIIRDRMEHDTITTGIALNRSYWNDHIKDCLVVDNLEIITAANDSLKELERLDLEIKDYIEQQLSKLNLRECCLFLNAFNRHFNKKPFTQLFPEETEYEIRIFDNEIKNLLKSK